VFKAPDGTAFDLTGPADAPLVVLIHGLGLSRRLWDDPLAAYAGFRVLTYDLYGHGDSAPPADDLSLTVFSDQLAGVMDHIGAARAHVVGFSIGGMINRRFALDHPGRLNRLVILNSPHNRGDDGQKAVEDRAKSVRDQGAFSTFDAALARWFTPDFLTNGHGADLVRHWRGQTDAESYAQAAWVLAHGVRELIHPTPVIKVPTLVMTCENDSGSTPQMSRDIAAEIPGSICQIIPRYQHLGLMEDPVSFTTPITQFLKDPTP